MDPVRWCLSFHAEYRCGHSGACCRAGWAIPFDRTEAARVEALPLSGVRGLVRPKGARGTAFAINAADGSCGFFDPADRLCAIHRAGGHRALPITCQMFPRIVLRDPRGAFVSLSHYCPTAAGLLFDADGPVSIVEAPSSLVQDIALDGLDATDIWPPLLRRGLMMDVDSYGTWERCAIDALTSDNVNPWIALGRVEAATEALLDWHPDDDPSSLARHVATAFDAARPAQSDPPDGTLWNVVRGATVDALKPPALSERWVEQRPAALAALEQHAGPVRRWLAARLFGAWMAYQGDGLRTMVGYLRAALDVLVVELARGAADGNLDRRAAIEAVRRSDHLLIHRAGSERLATLLA